MNMEIEVARLVLARAGFNIVPTAKTPRKTRAATPALNAIGKPFSPSYDPNYRMKYKPRQYACPAGYSQNLGGLPYTIPAQTGIPRVWEL